MAFVNPYNFVRSVTTPAGAPRGHHRYTGASGTLKCSLRVVTPLFLPAPRPAGAGRVTELRFFTSGGKPAVPGSSLKGMLRSLAEAISGACSPFGDNPKTSDQRVHPKCRSKNHLCLCCRLFGYLGRVIEKDVVNVYAGSVSVSDAHVCGEYELSKERIALKELSSPKPERHNAFYAAAGKLKGRKFYYHRAVLDLASITEANPTHRNTRVQPLLQGTFAFCVDYWNLAPEELGVLLSAIVLPEGLFHKLGMGKPLGLGSVRLALDAATPVTEADPARRYRSGIRPEAPARLEGATLAPWVAVAKRAYAQALAQALGVAPADEVWALKANNIDDLAVMLSQVPYHEHIRYPSYSWFQQDKRRPQKAPLADVQTVHRDSTSWLRDDTDE